MIAIDVSKAHLGFISLLLGIVWPHEALRNCVHSWTAGAGVAARTTATEARQTRSKASTTRQQTNQGPSLPRTNDLQKPILEPMATIEAHAR